MHRNHLLRGVHRWRAIGAAAALVSGALTTAASAQISARSIPLETPGVCRGTPEDIPSTSFQLSNGLTVVLHEDHKTPLVAMNLHTESARGTKPRAKPGWRICSSI
jgi:hypothetical protein